MLSPKTSDITDPGNTGTWNAETKGLWLPILTGSRLYQKSPASFGDLDSRLDAVEDGSLKGKQLSAALVLIDQLGPVDAGAAPEEGTFSTLDNREGLIEYALSTLYGADFWPTLRASQVGGTSSVLVRW